MAATKVYTIPQLKSLATKHKYRLGECLDATGSKVCPGHGASMKVTSWMDKTLKGFTERPGVDPGIYYVHLYQDTNKKTKPDTFPIGIGNYKAALSENGNGTVHHPVIIREKATKQEEDHPLDWSSALEYQRQISELRTQVQVLTLENNSLKKEIEDLQNEEPQGGGLLGENVQNFVSSILPVADQFFKMQQQKNMLEYMKLQKQDPSVNSYAGHFIPGVNPQGMPRPQAPGASQVDPVAIKCNEWTETLDEESWAKVEAVRNQVNNMQDFYNLMLQQEPELYHQMYNYATGGGQ